jgi:EEF1A lysine methyltransferase 4
LVYDNSEEGLTFDWFKGFNDVSLELENLIGDKTSSILHLGCGNSTLGEEMYKNGYRNIVNVDYSPTVIEFMSTRCKEMCEMKWITADIFEMDKHPELDSLFDIALDKGTLDALLTIKHDPWDPHQELVKRIAQYMRQISGRLRIGGKFLHITFCQPHFRRKFIEIEEFNVRVHQLSSANGGFQYFCYEAVKVK